MSGMGLGDVSVLDVGHGNCVLVAKGDRCCVIDTPTGATLIDTLSARGVTAIDAIFVSHADVDHIGGVTGLLMSRRFRIGYVFVNADAVRPSAAWRAFRVAVRDARRVGQVSINGLTTDTKFTGFEPEFRITALAPEPELVLGQAGLSGERMTSNSLSGVLLVEQAGRRLVLVSGDIDAAGLRYVLEEKRDITAKVLVFPHHGGLPGGGDPREFCKALCEAVQPSVVVFSLARTRFKNPHPDIVKALKETAPGAHIACTQLSAWCAKTLPSTEPQHLSPRPARGKPGRACCAGTLVLSGVEPTGVAEPLLERHREFIALHAPTSLCAQRPS